MANTVSSLKRVRQTEHKTAVNRLRKSRLRTQIRKLRRLVAANDANGAQNELSATHSLIDRAAKWGVIKKNAADRYKSRLTANVRKLTAAA